MLTIRDLAWAAGFLEGEGCFTPGGYGRKRGSCPWISAAQVQMIPLIRLQRMFGGSIGTAYRDKRFNCQPCHTWVLSASRAAALMMALYGLMSPRRQEQIKHSLALWKLRPVERRFRHHCLRGHAYDEANTYIYDGKRDCRKCRNMRARQSHQRRKQYAE